MLDKNDLKGIFSKKTYEVRLFEEHDFSRKQCSECGHFFWSIDSGREVCGDTLCTSGYQFIGKPTKKWDVHETIKKLNTFFEKNGHTIIDEYPVVARWRDDLDFTIASIADFQPWVLTGRVEPPANPLCVPQPCIRFGGDFNDLDNIGRTGRHLTCFVMYGQHAFNSESQKTGYWMDTCLDLNFSFLTSVLGISAEEISYVENIWMGGGNFGPNLEAFARGSELVNNVFMQYEQIPGSKQYRPMDLTVIDVGWGVERISWFTQGTPTIYEATMPDVVNYLKKVVDIQIDPQLYHKYAVLCGLLNVDEVKDINEAKSFMYKSLQLSPSEVENIFGKLEAVYAIADHTRTLIMAITDGALPSNVGGGYNLRNLIRRSLSLDRVYNLELDFTEIFERHIKDLQRSYPRVKNVIDTLTTVFDIERKQYDYMRKKGGSAVRSILTKEKTFSMEHFIEFYQSRGIPPEMVRDIATGLGLSVNVPADFYSALAESYKKGEKENLEVSNDKTENIIEEELQGIDTSLATGQLFYENSYRMEMATKVVGVSKDKTIIQLEETIFYPTGGGQQYDKGYLINKTTKEKREVVDVFRKNKTILHKLDNAFQSIEVGQEIKGELDKERRWALMRHHTGTHVLNGAAKHILGDHIWQEGANKTPEHARLDVSHYGRVSDEQVEKIERAANRVILENRKITKKELGRTEAEQNYGFEIYQGGIVPGSKIRIIDIDNWDIEACGGTHLDSTGDIGLLRILGTERIQDGIVRFQFQAGEPAVYSMQRTNKQIEEISTILQSPKGNIVQRVQNLQEDWKKQRSMIQNLQKQLVKVQLEGPQDILFEEIDEENKVLILEQTGTFKEATLYADSIVQEHPTATVIIGIRGPPVVFLATSGLKANLDITGLIRDASIVVGGGGGGKGKKAKGGGPKHEAFDDAIAKIKGSLKAD